MVVEDAAESLREHIPSRLVRVEAKHDSRMALNEAGTDETMVTTHTVVARVPKWDVNEFKRAVADIPDLGVEIIDTDIEPAMESEHGRERITLGVEE